MNHREQSFFNMLNTMSIFDVDMISNKGQHIESVTSQAMRNAKRTGLYSVKFECKLTNCKEQYPDVTITNGKTILLQCELKHREPQSVIIKQIDGMRQFAGKEFWYLLDEAYDLDYIKSQTHNELIKIIYIHEFVHEFNKTFGIPEISKSFAA